MTRVLTTPALATTGLKAGYGRTEVLHGLDLRVGEGEIVAVLGPNGAGKSTTLLALSGAIPSTGTVELFGAPATGSVHERSKKGLAFLPDHRGIIRALSVAQNLRLANVPLEAAYEVSPELEVLKDRKAGDLSGGEQQILALTRAVVSKPRLILVDEISFGLAPIIVTRMFKLLASVAEQGVGVLLVEQFAHLALAYADRAYVLQRGTVAMEGKASDLLADMESVERSYLGSAGAAVD
ncbi:MAG: ABC transporter ATP-binding protein [Nocardioides sp.]|uniref:ABC transporter ATP-binding protein n=1 Tax=Nocardioides sp. TaxID=35761 RepID=UPI0039E58BCF